LLAKTGCWYAEIKSRTDKTSQAATTAHPGLEGQLAVHLGLMVLLGADPGLVSNFRVSSNWISLGSYLGLTGT